MKANEKESKKDANRESREKKNCEKLIAKEKDKHENKR